VVKPSAPDLSIVLLAHRDSESLRGALRGLRGQSVSSQMECVLVVPSGQDVGAAAAALKGLNDTKIVEVGTMKSEGEAKAAGVRAAGAPLVAFLEDHSFPEETCAENLIEAHRRGDFAVVGPVMRNANPISSVSWGCFLAYYGAYMWARPEDEIRHLPANQSCYRRDLLLEYGSRLADMLEAEAVLHRDLLARGHRLAQEPSARVYHLNVSRLGLVCSEYFLASRVFAAERASGWGFLRRAVYAAGSPLLPLIRSPRMFRDARRAELDRSVLRRAFASALLTLCAGAAGEMLGYALGEGRAKQRLLQSESERNSAFSARDLEALSTLQ
jgi:hypothetical protein